jgi:hypothetical protein
LRGLEQLVEVATGADEWDAAIAQQLVPTAMTQERRGLRQAEARRHDWSRIADHITRIIRERVGNGTHDDV